MDNLLKLYFSTLENYNNADIAIKKDSVFFITDTKELYVEDKLYGESFIIVNDLNIDNPSIDTMYLNMSDNAIYIYTGLVFKLVIEPYSVVQEFDPTSTFAISGSALIQYLTDNPIIFTQNTISNLEYDQESYSIIFTRKDDSKHSLKLNKILANVLYDDITNTLSFKDADDTSISDISLIDKYVVSGKYDTVNKTLVFTLKDNTTVSIPATDLINIYSAENTSCLKTTIENTPNGNIIKIDCLLSKVSGNITTTKTDGIYIQYTEFNNKLNKVELDKANSVITALADGLVKASNYQIGFSTLNINPSSLTIATEKAVETFTTGLADKIFLPIDSLSATKLITTKNLLAKLNVSRNQPCAFKYSETEHIITSGGSVLTEKYSNDIWSMISASLNVNRIGSVSSFFDNKIFGGTASYNGEKYNKELNVWESLPGNMIFSSSTSDQGATSNSYASYITNKGQDVPQRYQNGIFSAYECYTNITYVDGIRITGGSNLSTSGDINFIKGLVFGSRTLKTTERLSDGGVSISISAIPSVPRDRMGYTGNDNGTTAFVIGGRAYLPTITELDNIESFSNDKWSMFNINLSMPRMECVVYSNIRNEFGIGSIITGGSYTGGSSPSDPTLTNNMSSEKFIEYNISNVKPTLYKQIGNLDHVPSEKLVDVSIKEMIDDFNIETNINRFVPNDNIISKPSNLTSIGNILVFKTNCVTQRIRPGYGFKSSLSIIYGGYNEISNKLLNTTEEYRNGIFRSSSLILNIARARFANSSTTDPNKLICSGGNDTSSIYSCTDSTEVLSLNTWKVSSIDLIKRNSASACKSNEKTLLKHFISIGGIFVIGGRPLPSNVVNFFDDKTSVWESMPILIENLNNVSVGVGGNKDECIVLGGSNETIKTTTWRYNLYENNTWSVKPSMNVGKYNCNVENSSTKTYIEVSGTTLANKFSQEEFTLEVWKTIQYVDEPLQGEFIGLDKKNDIFKIVQFKDTASNTSRYFEKDIAKSYDATNITNTEFISKYLAWKEI